MTRLEAGGGHESRPEPGYDAGFSDRWAAWQARGRARDQRTRRGFAALQWAALAGAACVTVWLAWLRF